jgi:hypothetical protein
MVININEFGQTLSIGALAILFFWIILFKILDFEFFLKKEIFLDTDFFKILFVTFFFGIMYVIGISLENVSRNIVSFRNQDNTSQVLLRLIPHGNNFKSECLLRTLKENDTITILKPDHLLITFYKSGIINKLDSLGVINNDPGFDCASLMISKPILISKKNEDEKKAEKELKRKFNAFSTYLYYYAKNEVYRNENYFEELKIIENRISFSRSLEFLSLHCVVVVTFFLFYYGFLHIKEKIKNREKKRKRQTKRYKEISRKLNILIITFLLYGAFLFIGNRSYTSEEWAYNPRVYGYFINICME